MRPLTAIRSFNRQVARVLDLPDVKERLQQIGFDGASSTSDAAATHMRAETEKWAKVVRDAKIKID
jgi:tripartite-type tricarboxylate transporter receptor subunit TctC